MRIRRRTLLEAGLALITLTGLPALLRAAPWPRQAFASEAARDALVNLYGTDSIPASDQIELSLPLIAENGSVVPVSVSTTLDDVRSISLVVENNPRPLAASFEILKGTVPAIDCRIKMGASSNVIAVVQTAGGLHSTSKEVTVTVGGCS